MLGDRFNRVLVRTDGGGDGELLGDDEVGEEHEEEAGDEAQVEVPLRPAPQHQPLPPRRRRRLLRVDADHLRLLLLCLPAAAGLRDPSFLPAVRRTSLLSGRLAWLVHMGESRADSLGRDRRLQARWCCMQMQSETSLAWLGVPKLPCPLVLSSVVILYPSGRRLLHLRPW